MKFFVYQPDPPNPNAPPPTPEMFVKMEQLINEGTRAGVILATGAFVGHPSRVSLSDGEYLVTDGPFVEAKELMGGYTLIEVKSREEAIAWAKRGLAITGGGTNEICLRESTSSRGVDVILDIVGGDYLQRNIECLAMHGRLIQIGLLGSSRAEINLRPLMQKRLTITGSTLRTRSVEEKGAIARALEVKVWPLLASRQVAPIIDRTLALADASEAHRLLESGEAIGKVVLVP